MNRVLVAGIAGIAMLVSAVFTSQECQAGRRCGGGGLFSGLGSARCGGQAIQRDRCGGGGLLARLHARRNACGGEAAPTCCEPAPAATCCEPAPAPTCCEPAPTCCEPAPTCCEPAPVSSCCSAPVSNDCCGGSVMSHQGGYISGGMMSSGCSNCSQTMDSGIIMESSIPSAAPPAPAPTPEPAADAPPAPAA